MNRRKEHEVRRTIMRKIERRLFKTAYARSQHAADELDRLETAGAVRPKKEKWKDITRLLSIAARAARELLRRLPLLLLLLVGCAAPRAAYRPLVSMRPIMAASATNYTAPAFAAVIPWQYGVDPAGYCWVLQASSNLADWVDLPGCTTDPLTARATNGFGYFRLKGSP